jgi:pilus assembly protein Flp/PilA
VAANVAPHHQEEKSMLRSIRKVLKSKSGATAIEYGLIAALISVVIIGALILVGQLNDLQSVRPVGQLELTLPEAPRRRRRL